MVSTTKEILFSRTKLPFSRTKYTRFKGNISRYVQKADHIYWHFYGRASSSPLLAVWPTHFYLNLNQHGISRLCTSTLFLLQSRHNISSQTFLFWVEFFTGNIYFGEFPDFVKFKDNSRTWKIKGIVHFHFRFSGLIQLCSEIS